MPLVSVVVPAFDAAATIGRALRSVQAQRYPAWEAIVVDDASRDSTAVLAAGLADPRIRVIELAENGGPARARNAGIAAARGEFLAFLDADDEWSPGKIEQEVAAMQADPAASLVVSDMRVLALDGSEIASVFTRQRPVAGSDAWKELLASPFVATSAVLTRRALLERIGGFDPDLLVGEDQDLFIRLALLGKVAVIAAPLATYHWTAASYSTGLATRQADDVLRMVRRHLREQRARLASAEIRAILGRRYARLGRNLVQAGARGAGSVLLLRATLLGCSPLGNLVVLLASWAPLRRLMAALPRHRARQRGEPA